MLIRMITWDSNNRCNQKEEKFLTDLDVIDSFNTVEMAAAAIKAEKGRKLLIPDEIDQSRLENCSLVEFDDYVYERYFKKKLVVIYGNCHTAIISKYLENCKEFNKDYSVYPIKPIHLIKKSDYFEKPIFKNCDVFIHQSIQLENRYGEKYASEKIISRLKPECKVIAIPNVYRLPVCFFPQYSREAEFTWRGKTVFFRDTILDKAAKKNMSINQIVDLYWNQHQFSGEYLDKELQRFYDKVQRREQEWDIKCLDFIKANYRTIQLFYDPNHPTNQFLLYVTQQIIQYMGIDYNYEKLKNVYIETLTGYEMPILPEVKKHFEMTFEYKEMRTNGFKIKKEKMYWQDYVKQYLVFEWQNSDICILKRLMYLLQYLYVKFNNQIQKLFKFLGR